MPTLHSSLPFHLHLLRTFFFPLPSSFNTHSHFSPITICLRHFSSPSEKSNGLTPSVIHEFLEKSCGLSHAEAIKASKYLLHLKTTENPDRVVCFFRDRGFTDAQIKNIARCDPRLLTYSIPNNLQPKLKLIEDLGTVDGELGNIISRIPILLKWNMKRTIAPGIATLQKVVKSNQNVITVLKRAHWKFFNFEKLKANLLFLEKEGIDKKVAESILLKSPCIFTSEKTHIKELLDTVEKLGVQRNSAAFSSAMAIVSSRSKDTVERKINFLGSLGLSKKEVLRIFVSFPYALSLSEKKIKCHMDFLVNILNLEPSITASYPTFLSYSMEKRILPRYRVFQALQSMGIVKTKVRFLCMVGISDKDFLDRFVNKHSHDSSRLYRIYEGVDPDIPSVNEGNISTMESQ